MKISDKAAATIHIMADLSIMTFVGVELYDICKSHFGSDSSAETIIEEPAVLPSSKYSEDAISFPSNFVARPDIYAIIPERLRLPTSRNTKREFEDNYSNSFTNSSLNKQRHIVGRRDRGYSASARRQHSAMKQEKRLSARV
jgi:hypothetical protein